jgi:RimJ/RimL family protein N-acetyltransferase
VKPPVPDLRDDLIVLRPPTEGDADAITAAIQDPDIPRYTRIPSPYTREDAIRFIVDTIAHWRNGTSQSLMITDAATGVITGGVGVHAGEHLEVREIGYWVARDARRRGLATRAVRLVSRWVIPVLGLRRLELMTHVDNVGSQAVAERAGFTREGVLRSYATIGCGLADVVMFSLLPEDLTRESG